MRSRVVFQSGDGLRCSCHRGGLPAVKPTSLALSRPANGGRDTARSLPVCPTTVLRELQKHAAVWEAVHPAVLRPLHPTEVAWDVERAGAAEMDELWSFVGHQGHPRWLWHALAQHTGKSVASVLGRRKDAGFLQRFARLEPYGLTRSSTE